MWNPYGGPFDGIAHGLGLLVLGFIWIIVLAVIVAVLVLLVRFLLVATTAAKLYVAEHSPAAAVVDAASPAAGTTVPAPGTTPPGTATAAPEAKKPRTPKTPPAV